MHKSIGESKSGENNRAYFMERELEMQDEHHEVAHGYKTETGNIRDVRRFKSMRDVRLSHDQLLWTHKRRLSHDETIEPTKFLIDVDDTQRRLLAQEDTDGDFQICVNDTGSKVFPLKTASSGGFNTREIRGTYHLSNLLQELALAADYGRKFIVVDERRLSENPVDRMERLIKYHFWDTLTRRIDKTGIELITSDPKARNPIRRIYVPCTDPVAVEYYQQVARDVQSLDVVILPEQWTPLWVKSKDSEPGILSLALKLVQEAHGTVIKGVPFVVPGGRFNEMYNWDSYFITLGLIANDRIELSKCMLDNFFYQVHHYHKILNANRSYYLTRSQPPFMTDMLNQVKDAVATRMRTSELIPWMARGWRACIKELLFVWFNKPRLDTKTGLVCYHPEGIGMPPETESTHFNHILEPFVLKHWDRLTTDNRQNPAECKDWEVHLEKFKQLYYDGTIFDSDLDAYFVHDRAVRESGHDTTYRFEKICAHLTTIDLNALLYRYSMDISDAMRDDFHDAFKLRIKRGVGDEYLQSYMNFYRKLSTIDKARFDFYDWDVAWARGILVEDDEVDLHWTGIAEPQRQPTLIRRSSLQPNTFPKDMERDASGANFAWQPFVDPHPDCTTFAIHVTSPVFHLLARNLRIRVNKYCWNEEKGMYFDYNIQLQQQSTYESVTTTWPLWAKMATREQASYILRACENKFEQNGGLVAGTSESRGQVGLDRPSRQWDFPLAWAPHQVLAWVGLENYGYEDYAQRLIYRWLFMLVSCSVEFNGVIAEKLDCVESTHKVHVEYGNEGLGFKLLPREGFGWTNASFVVGLNKLSRSYRRALGALTSPEALFRK